MPQDRRISTSDGFRITMSVSDDEGEPSVDGIGTGIFRKNKKIARWHKMDKIVLFRAMKQKKI